MYKFLFGFLLSSFIIFELYLVYNVSSRYTSLSQQLSKVNIEEKKLTQKNKLLTIELATRMRPDIAKDYAILLDKNNQESTRLRSPTVAQIYSLDDFLKSNSNFKWSKQNISSD